MEKKYFTPKNNNTLFNRLKSELSIRNLPYLGPCSDYGVGDAGLEEVSGEFVFYVADRDSQIECKSFTDIKEAIQHLVDFYGKYNQVNDPNKMKAIFFDTLGL